MNTIIYHGLTAERLSFYVEMGEIAPLNPAAFSPASRLSKPEYLAGIEKTENQVNQTQQTNRDLRMAVMWALVDEIASQNAAECVYVLELIVDDKRISRGISGCLVDISEESIPLCAIRRFWTIPVGTRERMIAAAFCHTQDSSRTLGIDIDKNDYHLSYIRDNELESIAEDLDYISLPEPLSGAELTADVIPVAQFGSSIFPFGVATSKDVRSVVSRLQRLLLSEAMLNEREDTTGFWADVEIPSVGWMRIDMGRFLLHDSPLTIARVLTEGSCSPEAESVVDYLAPTCRICAGALNMVEAHNAFHYYLAKEDVCTAPEKFKAEYVRVIFNKAEEWLKEHDAEKYNQVMQAKEKIASFQSMKK